MSQVKESQLFDPSEEHKKQASGICEKFRAVSWKKVFTLVVVVVDFILVSASLSLIAAFFTTKVFYIISIILSVHFLY